ncbi:MAG: hypothetical protein ACRDPH_12345 [Marmoricola sp.]
MNQADTVRDGAVTPGQPDPLPLDEFGPEFLRRVLHRDRVLASIDRALGDRFELGPMGAGPGRRIARLTARGRYLPSYGEVLSGDRVGYLVVVPVEVAFDITLPVDSLRFQAEVLVPLTVELRTVAPLTILWDITPPSPDAVTITLTGETRRSAVVQRLAGLDGELRRFLARFVERELDKPHIRRARRIDLETVIDTAWEHIACQFLPNGPQDRS